MQTTNTIEKNRPVERAVGRKVPKYQTIRDDLIAAIRSGRYASGVQLPTERELAAKYGVHRMTVRQATMALVRSGMVIKRRPQGNFVSDNPSKLVGEKQVNLVCIGMESSQAEIFVEHGVAAALKHDIQARVLRIYPGSEHVAAESVNGPDPSVIIGGVSSVRSELGVAVRDARDRVIMIGSRMDHAGVRSIVGDDEFGIRLAVEHLHEYGHERIGLIGSVIGDNHPLMELQVQLWRQAMISHGLPRGTIQKHIIRLKPATAGGIAMAAYEAVKAYYARQRIRATAHIALCEESAIGAAAALNELGVDVPREVSLVDYAGTCRARLCIPPLTAIDVNVDQHLVTAMQQVEAIMEQPHTPPASGYLTVIPPVLIERGSTAKRR
ncbi:MAG: substrate-binding domain-containing protein [Planctomycetota bacterium]